MTKKVPVKNLNQMRTTRAADKEMFHYLDEKQGSAHDFRRRLSVISGPDSGRGIGGE